MPETRQTPPFRHTSRRGEQSHVLGPGERTPTHQHPRGHLVHPARGVLSVTTGEGTWLVPANRTAWVPGGYGHHHRSHGGTDMRVVFLPAAMARALPPHPAVLTPSPLAREALLALTGTAERDAAARARLRRVVIDELAPAPEEPLHLPEPRDPRLRDLARRLEACPGDPAGLRELGRRIGVGERTLSRLFHAELGMSFTRWRAQLRVHHALVLLTGGASVLETALACGWANPSTFIEHFTAVMGQTPGRYRRDLLPPPPSQR
jgi:AraC-like DNA-binding protein